MSTFGIVLAGGASSRMGSNKAELVWHDQPMVVRQFSLLEKAGLDDVVVSGHWKGLPCMADEVAYAGPLSALFSIFQKLPLLTRIVVIPVDMPLLEDRHLLPLIESRAGLAAYREHPLPFSATLTPSLLSGIARRLKLNQGALHGLWDIVADSLWLDITNNDFLANANTPEEWHTLQEKHGKISA